MKVETHAPVRSSPESIKSTKSIEPTNMYFCKRSYSLDSSKTEDIDGEKEVDIGERWCERSGYVIPTTHARTPEVPPLGIMIVRNKRLEKQVNELVGAGAIDDCRKSNGEFELGSENSK